MSRDVHAGAAACRWTDTSTVHLLGRLSAGESTLYLQHLGACAACRAELDESERVVAELDCAVATADLERGGFAASSDGLRAKLLERVAADSARTAYLEQVWKHWTATPAPGASTDGFGPGLYAVSAQGGDWEDVGLPGIAVKRLSTDAARRKLTMLVRMAPGSAYPPHRHGSDEQCFVVSGELRVGERRMYAGDFQLALAGSVHETQSTETGCVLLLVSSPDDEMLA